jgi:metal-responsive CopG/Arc/MetJ family transcriptional regulator
MARQDRERGERLQIMLSAEELAAVDDFRFSNRIPSRAATIRKVLRRGLGVKANKSAAGSRASDFGVLGIRSNNHKTASNS